MNVIGVPYNVLIYQPLLNILTLAYLHIPGGDFGVAVIMLTLFIRLLLYPVTAYGVKIQKRMNDIQPKLEKIKQQFKDDKQQQGKAIFALYKEEKVNPFAGILPILIQLPIFFALFQLFGRGFGEEQFAGLYSFVTNPGLVDPYLFGLVNLAETSIAMAVVAGIFQFLQLKQAAPPKKKKKAKDGKPDFASMMQTQMLYVFPFIAVLIVATLPSAFGLYWIVSSLFSIGQYWYMNKSHASANTTEHKTAH
jgi:YidC/Oxa1 family membrane protein insertase